MNNELVADALRIEDMSSLDPEEAGAPRAVTYLRVSTSRQAHKNGEAEGYSIPAQRDACARRVGELGAEVIREFTDAGASARSADRPGLQEMLRFVGENNVSYVVVHKLDRLARDRADDVAILLAIKSAGAVLISVTENIDDTPAGKFQHAVMAGMAEYYSSNLSHEAKKGIAQKAKSGGTHGVAPLGYLNTVARIEGREVKGVMVDNDRAEHIRWGFRLYAEGQTSISQLRDLLEERGLRSRKTLKYVGSPLSNAQVHRMLGNPYYIGKIVHRGVIHDGAHEAIVDDDTWYEVQRVRSGRRIAGDRSWKHNHFLKGSLTCHRCGGRMGFGYSRGEGGQYAYFFCLGRHTGRTTCDLPYLPAGEVEKEVRREWRRKVHFSPEQIEQVSADVQIQLELHQTNDCKLVETQKRRLVVLERKKQRLLDAYLDCVIEEADLKNRQGGLLAEIDDAKRLIRQSEFSVEVAQERVALLLRLMSKAVALYDAMTDEQKGWLNRTVFTSIRVDVIDDDPQPFERGEIAADGLFSEPVAAMALVLEDALAAANGAHTGTQAHTRAKIGDQPDPKIQNRTPGGLSPDGGSNVYYLAERERFELSVSLPTTVFKTVTINHSVTSPCAVLGIF